MGYINDQIELIKQKVSKLAERNHSLEEENRTLKSELSNLKELIETQKNTLKGLEERNKISKIADTVSMAAREKRELKLKINQYVREIDRCIALLND